MRTAVGVGLLRGLAAVVESRLLRGGNEALPRAVKEAETAVEAVAAAGQASRSVQPYIETRISLKPPFEETRNSRRSSA